MTVHHWDDVDRGLAELRRVARDRSSILTWDPEVAAESWLTAEYLPELRELDLFRFDSPAELAERLGGADGDRRCPIPADCRDGFIEAFWARPEAYLDPVVREGMSGMRAMDQEVVAARDGAAGGRPAQRRVGPPPRRTCASAPSWSWATGWYWPSRASGVILVPDAARVADRGGAGAGRPVPRHRPGGRDPLLAGQRLLRGASPPDTGAYVSRGGPTRSLAKAEPFRMKATALGQVPAVRDQARLPAPARRRTAFPRRPSVWTVDASVRSQRRPLLVRAHRRVRALPRGHRRRQGPGVQGRDPAGRGRPAPWTPTAT